MSTTQLQRALEAAHQLGAPNPPWREFIRLSCDVLGATGGVFLAFDPAGTGLCGVEEYGSDPSAVREYGEHFQALDVLKHRSHYIASGDWMDSDIVLPSAARTKNAYYADFMCKYRMRQIFCFVIEKSQTQVTSSLSFQREFSAPSNLLDGEGARAFTAALRSAMARRKAEESNWIRSVDAMFARFDEGVFLLDATGAILHSSSYALEFLDRNSGVRVRGGSLWHGNARVRALLQAAPRAVLSGGRPVHLLLPSSAGRTCQLDFAIVDVNWRLDKQRLVMARVRAQSATAEPSFEAFAAVFGLTPGETHVLRELVTGATVTDIAASHTVSVHTVRKQVAVLLEKAGCTRQADLIRMALAA
jgi:DNA-binding CsgD family transcriptional regulator